MHLGNYLNVALKITCKIVAFVYWKLSFEDVSTHESDLKNHSECIWLGPWWKFSKFQIYLKFELLGWAMVPVVNNKFIQVNKIATFSIDFSVLSYKISIRSRNTVGSIIYIIVKLINQNNFAKSWKVENYCSISNVFIWSFQIHVNKY